MGAGISTYMKLGTQLLTMLRKEAEADIAKAKLSLTLLNDAATGIGDHSTGDYYKNAREALDLLCDAEDRYTTLIDLIHDKEQTVIAE